MADATPERRLELLSNAVARRGATPDRWCRRLASRGARCARRGRRRRDRLQRAPANRRVLAAVGYGPKMLVRVARLRRLVSLRDGSLASRALEAGYASQAHMSDEVRSLTGLTPVRFLEDAELTAA